MKLARQLDRGFGGFRAPGGEVDASAAAEIRRRKRQQTRCELFGGFGMKLRSVREGNLRGLIRYRLPDFGDTVANADDGGLSGCVQQAPAVGGVNPAAFAAHGDWKRFP